MNIHMNNNARKTIGIIAICLSVGIIVIVTKSLISLLGLLAVAFIE